MAPTAAKQRGFTYLGLAFVLAYMASALLATGVLWRLEQQREREAELLFVGAEFQRAIGAYYDASPGKTKEYPKELEHLVRDARYLEVRRYLRKIYVDPMTGSREWGLVKTSSGGVVGVYSHSQRAPLKRANFPEPLSFAGARRHSDWRFVHEPASRPPPVVAAAQAAGTSGVPGSAPAGVAQDTHAAAPASESACSVLARDDRAACEQTAVRYGEEAGALCQATIAARIAACMQGRRLPVLATQR